jgi:hypothetical protein
MKQLGRLFLWLMLENFEALNLGTDSPLPSSMGKYIFFGRHHCAVDPTSEAKLIGGISSKYY